MKYFPRIAGLVVALLAVGLNIPSARADQIFLTLKSVTGVTNFDDGALRYRTDVQVVENYAYLSWIRYGDTNRPGGLEIFDVSNPSDPVRVGGCDGRAEANGICVAGRYAYLAGGAARNYTNDTGWLEIIDVVDPSNPVRVGGIQTAGRGLAVRVNGSLAYVTESVRWTGTNLLGALEIFDVRNATSPVRVSTFDTGGPASSVAVSGDFAYLADGVTDLEVLDVSNPAEPRRVGGFDTDEFRNHGGYEHGGAAVHVQVAGHLVYSAGQDGLHILDITNPAVPVRIGGYNDLPFDLAFSVSGRYACVSFYTFLRNAFSLFVYDVSDPVNPAWIGRTDDIPSAPRSIQVAGRRLYAAGGSLLIYEITDEPAFRSMSRTEETLILTWNAPLGFKLQSTASLTDPVWRDVPGVGDETRVELPLGSGNAFFRLFKP